MRVNGTLGKVIFRVLISGALVAYLIYSQNMDDIQRELREFNFYYLLVSLLCLLAATFFSSLRWRAVLNYWDCSIRIFHLVHLYLRGCFYNNFFPTQIGGDVYKSISLGKTIGNHARSLLSVFLDRLFGLVIQLSVALIGVAYLYGFKGLLGVSLFLLLASMLYFLFVRFFAARFIIFKKIQETTDLIAKNKRVGLAVLSHAVLVHVFATLFIYSLFLGAGVSLPLLGYVLYIPLALSSILLPSFNGFGTQEAIYIFLFSRMGVPAEISVTVSLMVHALKITLSLIGGVSLFFKLGEGTMISTAPSALKWIDERRSDDAPPVRCDGNI